MLAAEPGYSGCRLWASCRGTRCRGETAATGPNRHPWVSPTQWPKHAPEGERKGDRNVAGCPLRMAEPWMHGAIVRWQAWRRLGGMPGPGGLGDQDARLVAAIGILEGEMGLIELAHQERAMAEAQRRAKAGKGE